MSQDTTFMPQVRWLIQRDLTDILRWELDTPGGWTAKRYESHRQKMDTVSLVVTLPNDRIVGVVVYRLLAGSIRIIRISVDPAYRRRGVGGMLLEKLKMRVRGNSKRFCLLTAVPERNLGAQLFLSSQGFTGEMHPRKPGKLRFSWVIW